MKKIFKKVNFSELAGNMAGGVVASMAEEYIPQLSSNENTNDYIKIGIMAVAGSLVAGMSNNSIIKGTGNGMVAFAGANLYDKLTAPKAVTAGIHRVGLLPSQSAVGNLASQNAVGTARWIREKGKKVASVQ